MPTLRADDSALISILLYVRMTHSAVDSHRSSTYQECFLPIVVDVRNDCAGNSGHGIHTTGSHCICSGVSPSLFSAEVRDVKPA